MHAQRTRLNDPEVARAAECLMLCSLALSRRLVDWRQAKDGLMRGLALIEAGSAAQLVESLLYEIALRLAVHGIHVDVEADIAAQLAPYRAAEAEHNALFAPIAEA